MVRHDLITGMPESLYAVHPCIDSDGDMVMCPTGGVVEMDAPTLDDIQPSPVEKSDTADPETDEDITPVDLPDGVPPGALRWARGEDNIDVLAPATRLWYRPNPKRGASAVRYAIYCKATTVGEALALNAPAYARRDLKNDLERGLCWVLPPAGVAYAAWLATTPMGLVYAVQHSPVPALEDPVPVCPYVGGGVAATQRYAEPWDIGEAMQGQSVEDHYYDADEVEMRRLLALEEGPPLLAEGAGADAVRDAQFFAEYDHSLPGDQRRHTARYITGAAAARAALHEDDPEQGHRDWASPEESVPKFCAAFDIAPVTVMFGESGPDMVPPRSVSAARRLLDYAAPFGWKHAITKEIRRVEGFKAWTIVPMAQFWAESREFPGRVSIGLSLQC